MCPKCAGNGRYYTELFAGAWMVNPCLCSHSMTVRQAKELEFQKFKERLAEFRNGYERKNGNRSHGELLPTT